MAMTVDEDGFYTVPVMELNKPTKFGNTFDDVSFKAALPAFLKSPCTGEFGMPTRQAAELNFKLASNTDLTEADKIYFARVTSINLDNISHKVTDVTVDDKGQVFCKFKPLGVPKGKELIDRMNNGMIPQLGMRAIVKHDKDNRCIVQSIISFDVINAE